MIEDQDVYVVLDQDILDMQQDYEINKFIASINPQ